MAKQIKRVELDGLPAKGDVVDWLDSGKGLGDLTAAVKAAVVVAEAPVVEVEAVEVGYLELPAGRRLEVGGALYDGRVVEIEAGHRVVTLRKLYNVREGWTAAEDTLPPRLLEEPLSVSSGEGPGTGVTLSPAGLARMIASYYAAHGWTDRGEVPAERVEALRMADLVPSPEDPR